jgi:exonuclease SbcC
MINFEPIKLTIKDFMGHIFTELDFTQFQSAIILGKLDNNERKSNGTGKSTIAHAINFVLFAETPAGCAIDDIIRDQQSIAECTLEAKIGQDLYKIQRKRGKKTELKLYRWINSKWDPEDRRTTTQTDHALKELIKINFDTWKNTYLFAQGKLSEICESKTGLERRKLLKEPLNLVIYTKLFKIADARLKETEKSLELKKDLISNLGTPEVDIKETNLLLDQIINSINVTNYNIQQNNIDLENKQQSLKQLESLSSSDVKVLTNQLSELGITKNSIISTISTLQNQFDSQNRNQKSQNEQKEAKTKEILECKAKLCELEEKIVRTEEEIN